MWNDGMEVESMAVGSRIEALDDVCTDIQKKKSKNRKLNVPFILFDQMIPNHDS